MPLEKKRQNKQKAAAIQLIRELLWEMLGVVILTTLGGYSGIMRATDFVPSSVNLVGITIAHSGSLYLLISLAGPVSGGHLNPIITIGAFILGDKSLSTSVIYIFFQMIASVIGGFLIFLLHGEGYDESFGYPKLNPDVSITKGFFFELIGSFFLTYVSFYCVLKKIDINIIALNVGIVVAILLNSIGPLTGGCVNPARAFGPGIFDTKGEGFFRRGWWIYYSSSIIGGVIGTYFAIFMAGGEKDETSIEIDGSMSIAREKVENERERKLKGMEISNMGIIDRKSVV